MSDREPCPDCGLLYEHRLTCQMYGMNEAVSSLLYGYPICQCCGLPAGSDRFALHVRDEAAIGDRLRRYTA